MRWRLVIPAARVSGGTREAFRLAKDLAAQGDDVRLLAMWSCDHPMDSPVPLERLSDWKARASRAATELPWLWLRFFRWLRNPAQLRSATRFVFTHYTTLPLALLVPAGRRYFFVQDLEWKFIGQRSLARLLRHGILYCYRRGILICANAYLTAALRDAGLSVAFETPIWADEAFASAIEGTRDIDFVMMLRKGAHKRLDLYRSFIELATRRARSRIAVISPEEEIAASVRDEVSECLSRPDLGQMRALYARSKCFVHLSDHEGFGLPPLEAMGAGCVPLCRDSGGVRAFMQEPELAELLLPAAASVEEILERGLALVGNPGRLRAYSAAARAVFLRRGTAVAHSREAAIRRLLGDPATNPTC